MAMLGKRRTCSKLPALSGVALALALLLTGAFASVAQAAPPSELQVGSQTLRLCEQSPLVAYCGRLLVPLDRGVYAHPKIGIAYRWYPAGDGEAARSVGTVVPVEGGPGYASIESVEEGYETMYGKLLHRRNMLVIDNRGTGRSTPVECPALQDFEGPTASTAYQQDAADCAESLNTKWHAPGGAPIHAADLFTTAAAAADMNEVIQSLGLTKIDLYGDSYGSFFAQVFAARYPQLIRSLTLDSTYGGEAEETLPFVDHDELIRHINDVCARWSACAGAEHQQAWATIGELAAALRSAPISGIVPGRHGEYVTVKMDVVGLVDLLNDAAGDKAIYAAIDAAARAALGGYDAPLLRLYEQRLVLDEDYFGEPVRDYSVGLYTDVSCTDYEPLYDYGGSIAQRTLEYEQTLAAAPAGSFAPFTPEEWADQDQNTNSYSACLDWPQPTIAEPPFEHPGPELPSTFPVLVLGGELDIWTPPAEVKEVIEFLGGDSRYVEIANATHVVGEDDSPCGDALVRAFVLRPSTLHTLDTSCAAEPPIHAVGVYPRTLGEEPAATLVSGEASETELKLLAAAVQTAGDGIARMPNISGSKDLGLNGGSVKELEEGAAYGFKEDELIAGVPVSGITKQRPAHPASDGLHVKAKLEAAAGASHATLVASWTTAGPDGSLATIKAKVDGKRVTATLPAP